MEGKIAARNRAFSASSAAIRSRSRTVASAISASVKRAVMACAGFGITRVLSYQAADAIARGSLRRLLPANEGDELPIHLIYPGGRHPPPKLRAFLDFAVPRMRRRCAAIPQATGS